MALLGISCLMNRFWPPFVSLVFFSGCGAPPKPAVSASEVIGREIDTSMVVVPPKPKPGVTSPAPPPPAPQFEVWKLADAIGWYKHYVQTEKGPDVGLLYQGSDGNYHRFVARIPSTGGWVRFAIAKSELAMPREMPYRSTPSQVSGYGFVDPFNDFQFLPRVGPLPL